MDLLPVTTVPRRGRATVTIAADARPERAAHVRLEAFDGPLALLLALIEGRQLDILEVSLGDLAGAYLEAVSGLGEARMPHISSFITVCSQLILIKSRALLPRTPALQASASDDGLDPEAELRERLILYRTYRDAGAALAERLAALRSLFHREQGAAAAAAQAGARPPQGPPLDVQLLVAALDVSMRLAPVPEPPPEIMPRIITMEERAAVIRQALRRADHIVLQELLRDVHDRVVVAVTFLAMLELVKGHELVIEQSEPWGPIWCHAVDPDMHTSADRDMAAIPIATDDDT